MPAAWSQPFNPRSAGERVRPSSQSEDGSDRSRARVGRGARSALAIRHERPRRWCDAGAPGRQSGPASQKAGVEAAGSQDLSADLDIVMTLRAKIHRTATPTR
ncbi:MAG: hypothetical protein E4H44_05440, partial [Candidatus Aminicenantes bacterium]